MTANVLEFRRARAFADAVDAREARFDEENPDGDGQYDHLIATVASLATVPGPTLDPEVRLTQRALLVAEFERAFAGGGGAVVPEQRSRRGSHRAMRGPAVAWPPGRWGRRLAVGGLASMMALGTLGGVAVASSNALPGDMLYGMKRGLEDWRLNLAGSDAQRGRLLLDEASTRMTEARALMSRSGGHTLSPQTIEDVHRALTDMNVEGKRGRDLLNAIYRSSHSLAPLRQLAGFATTQSQALNTIEPRLPGQLDPVATQVRSLLSGINAEVTPLLPPTSGSGSTSTAPRDASASPTTGGTASQPQQQPSGGTTSGTGTMQGASPSTTPSGTTTSGTGALVGGLTGVLGNGGSAASTSGAPSPSGSQSDGTSTGTGGTGGSGLTVPPLVPGLLPTIGIGLSGGS
ncbi:DUF5667 domain-containing protein [Streptacidiphilus fuscans]|uniref:DUF5667 domain-containing protein n=1 Tax=Streptacidiphilus fuscans TaxID=2789292 RepID=A0A931FIM4_9ACTN|nr:DUF5667 domain-containing protein [Streptacidiphilus fuscans]MBF9073490.1 hypothetical protein [Streptacidiphilus fuscans]